MPTLPVGNVTFFLTDIEGSTRLVHELGSSFGAVLDAHHAIVRRAIETNGGLEVSTEGDAFFAVFRSAADAVNAAVTVQRELASADWPEGVSVAVRIGLHTGDGVLGGDNYMGVDVHRAARISAAGYGGQVLLSDATRGLVASHLPEGVELRDLGRHRLKDLPDPENLTQLVIEGLPNAFPALRTAEVPPTNIVAPATALIGRDRDLRELESLLASTRLLTLTGPGGTGKTRLATELGTRAVGRYRDGVFLVALETFEERSPAAGEIGRTVGARVPGQRDPEDNLVEHLAEREVALLLDNLEQLAGAGPLVSRLLTGAPRVRVVATSRIPLHVSFEQEYPVSPLDVPAPDEAIDVESLLRVEAVALFVDRAKRARPGYRLTESDAPAVAAICRRLDGLPLAIELAAARVRIFSPAALLSRLDRALQLLDSGNVDLPARQRTLRAAIEWSCALLEDPLQALFRRLTVFSGGWTVEAAEQVVASERDLGLDTLDGLMALVDHSLIRARPDDDAGETRFDMLQLIREYGAERLAETPDAALIGQRHAEWILALAEQAAAALESDADPNWLDRMRREHDNLRAALRWAVANRELELGLRLATAAWRFWQQRGHTREGREWLDRLLPQTPDSELDPAVVAAAHTAAGGLAYWQNDLAAAEAHYERALDLDRSLGLTDRLGNDVYNLGFVSMFAGDLDGARRRFDESADLFSSTGQLKRLADTTLVRGAVEMRAGHIAEARKWATEGRRLHLEHGNRARATDGAMVLSFVEVALDDLEAAQTWIETAMSETAEAGYVARWPLIYEVGVALALKRNRPLDALRLAGAAARRRETLGGSAPTFFASIDQFVAEARAAAITQGDADTADAAWAEGELLDGDALSAILRGLAVLD
jgi:predicted ATPase/class 3 adenylate cyclase